MSGWQPIVAVEGQLEAAGLRRIEANLLNLGSQDPIIAGNTVTVTKTNTFIDGGLGSRVNVDTILGGEDGDLLVLFADNIRLQPDGNIGLSTNFKMDLNDSITMLNVQGVWLEIARSGN